MAFLGTWAQGEILRHTSCGFRAQHQAKALPALPLHHIYFLCEEAFFISFPCGYKNGLAAMYLTNGRRYDRKEFSAFKILSWIHKGDKTRYITSEKKISPTLGAPGEFLKIAESCNLPQRFWLWSSGERARDVHSISPPRGFYYRWSSGWCEWSPAWRKGKQCGQDKWLPQCWVQTCIVIFDVLLCHLSVYGTVHADGVNSLQIRNMFYFFMSWLLRVLLVSVLRN